MYSLPTTITIRDSVFKIRNEGDFRLILDCFNALNDVELTQQERIISCLLMFYEDINSVQDLAKLPDLEEAILKMYDFFNCGEKRIGMKVNYKLIDWEQDEQIICSAVNNVARTEIRALPYLHWWTFMGYYLAVNESVLSTIVSIRHKIKTGKKLEKYEKDFKRDNPQYFIWDSRTLEEKELTDSILELWNKER